jgi:hypothetical protein
LTLPLRAAMAAMNANPNVEPALSKTERLLRLRGMEQEMSQRNVERVIGRLVTDEAFRRQFVTDPSAVLGEITRAGVELNDCEVRALAAIDPQAVARFTESIDPRLQKSDLHGGCQ